MIFSEMIMAMLYFFFLTNFNMNSMLFSYIYITFMILESCLCIVMLFEKNNINKMFYLNKCLLF